jgi:hypothetical protein
MKTQRSVTVTLTTPIHSKSIQQCLATHWCMTDGYHSMCPVYQLFTQTFYFVEWQKHGTRHSLTITTPKVFYLELWNFILQSMTTQNTALMYTGKTFWSTT